MKSLVVFESMFGNTQAVAMAVAEGLLSRMDTELAEVGSAPLVVDNDGVLLVVGGPTHAFGMSRTGLQGQKHAWAAEGAKPNLPQGSEGWSRPAGEGRGTYSV